MPPDARQAAYFAVPSSDVKIPSEADLEAWKIALTGTNVRSLLTETQVRLIDSLRLLLAEHQAVNGQLFLSGQLCPAVLIAHAAVERAMRKES